MLVLKNSIQWIMLVSGLITATMFYGLLAPEAALLSFFGETTVLGDEPLPLLVVRSWSGLVGLMGVVLIVGFFRPLLREFALILASLSKLIFVTLVFLFGKAYLENLAFALAMDIVVILAACVYFCLPDQRTEY
ncbi:hypothetical protein [Pseudoteredinibacter isoporae]|uniref:hypothetical protein n=1 Tax=Pseudoteredinibacter isoporae TaxID=570281 RepID=UPI0031079E5F